MTWKDIVKLDVSNDMYDYAKDALIRYINEIGMTGYEEDDIEEIYSEKSSPYEKARFIKHVFTEEMQERNNISPSAKKRTQALWTALSDAMIEIEGTA